MQRIAIVTHSLFGGGAERIAVNLANQWATESVTVHLVSLRADADYAHLLSSDVHLVQLNASRLRYSVPALRRALRSIAPEAVLSVGRDSNIPVALACWPKDLLRVVFREANTLHGMGAGGRITGFARYLLMRWAYRRADVVIANSEDTRNDLLKAGIAHDNVTVIPNPVLPPDFHALGDGLCDHVWLNDPALRVVLAAGRLNPQKDFAMLLDAFARLSAEVSDVRLVILGKGDEQPALEARAQALGIADNVDFAGFVDNPLPYYRKADAFALTSRWEGFGNVMVESLSMGTPVVATDCPGGPAFILGDGQYGRLVPVGNAEAFAAALRKTLSEPPAPETLVQRAEEFTVTRIARQYGSELGLQETSP